MNININCPGCAPNRYPPVAGAMNPQSSMMQLMGMMMTVMSSLMAFMVNPSGGTMMGGFPGFGGTAPLGGPAFGAMPGAQSFLGGGGAAPTGGGGGGFAPAGGPTVDPSSIQGAGWGADMARFAAGNANGPGGWCYKWVKKALSRHGVNVTGGSAYMAADQLAKHPKFREIRVNPQDLKKLPPGAVVVWNKGPGKPHGHISIALGNGKEASDRLRDQITNYGTGVRVFLPR